MASTLVGPHRTTQLNADFYVGIASNFYPNIQSAVDDARVKNLGVGRVVIAQDYGGTDPISGIVNGTVGIYICDQRGGMLQNYVWNGANYIPADFVQARGYTTRGMPTVTPGSTVLGFDPIGANGNGHTILWAASLAGKGMPALSLFGQPSDGTAIHAFIRCDADPTGRLRIQAPQSIEILNLVDEFNLWTGEPYRDGSKGMTVHAKAAENAIDFQGQTVGGAADQAIRINPAGGDVEIAPNGTITLGDVNAGDINAGDINGGAANLATCEVSNSPVRTFANTPDAPGGMIWPTAGIAVSKGDSWDNSINPANVPSWPGAGVAVSKGNAWDTPIDPTKIANWPGVGVAVSKGNAWDTPINPADIPRLSAANVYPAPQTQRALIATGTVSPQIPPAGCGTLEYVTVQNTLTAVANSATATNGAVQFVGTNTTGANGQQYLKLEMDSNGLTRAVLPNGTLQVLGNIGSSGVNAANGGLTMAWNPLAGNGESCFINARPSGGGGFKWYNVASNAHVDGTTSPSMWLDSAATLHTSNGFASVAGSIIAAGANGLLQAGDEVTNVADASALVPRLLLGVNGQSSRGWQGAFIWSTSVPGAGTSTDQRLELRHHAPDIGGSSALFMVNRSGDMQLGIGGTLALHGGGTNQVDVWGSLYVSSTFTVAGAKNFAIPHPLDKENKILTHSCLEGPEIAVFYRGEATTQDGSAEITLPAYFEALTRPENRTVQLTAIFETDADDFAQLAASRVADGKFRVRSSVPSRGFFWEVKAVRSDLAPLEVETTVTEANRRTPPPQEPTL
jgi:hypothetical protein